MTLWSLFFLAIGLSMDAFAVSICKGLAITSLDARKIIIPPLYFGIFQGIMPFLGYFLSSGFQTKIIGISHWVAFILLSIIGLKMIIEAMKNFAPLNDHLNYKEMLPLAIATSIDALAVGITLQALEVSIMFASIFIAINTFFICLIGMKIGNIFGTKFQRKAQVLGGIILITLGCKFLLEHFNLF